MLMVPSKNAHGSSQKCSWFRLKMPSSAKGLVFHFSSAVSIGKLSYSDWWYYLTGFLINSHFQSCDHVIPVPFHFQQVNRNERKVLKTKILVQKAMRISCWVLYWVLFQPQLKRKKRRTWLLVFNLLLKLLFVYNLRQARLF